LSCSTKQDNTEDSTYCNRNPDIKKRVLLFIPDARGWQGQVSASWQESKDVGVKSPGLLHFSITLQILKVKQSEWICVT
jgi:hypothetical protein